MNAKSSQLVSQKNSQEKFNKKQYCLTSKPKRKINRSAKKSGQAISLRQPKSNNRIDRTIDRKLQRTPRKQRNTQTNCAKDHKTTISEYYPECMPIKEIVFGEHMLTDYSQETTLRYMKRSARLSLESLKMRLSVQKHV